MSTKTPLFTWRRLALGAFFFVIGWYAVSYPRGMAMAYIDHACGQYEVKAWGLPAPSRGEYMKLLREKYDIEEDIVGGCSLFPTTEWYADGYNSVARPMLMRKYNKDIFAECFDEAGRKWQAEHPGEW